MKIKIKMKLKNNIKVQTYKQHTYLVIKKKVRKKNVLWKEHFINFRSRTILLRGNEERTCIALNFKLILDIIK